MLNLWLEPRIPTSYMAADVKKIWQELNGAGCKDVDSLGWLDCAEATASSLPLIMEKAREIRERADTFVVVGVGGSNQAARAVINALQAREIQFVWLGNTLSASQIRKELEKLEKRSVYIQVIAKNFETLEPGSHYRLLRSWMKERYSPEEFSRRFVLTGTTGTRMHEIAQEHGHLFLPFPIRIGGRYSAFTPVALLPIAVAGLNVHDYLQGGIDIQTAMQSSAYEDVYRFAAWRNNCLVQGFDIEILCAFEPQLERFGRWWRQLFGESEGKDGKGIFPASVICSEDLHSMGQYMQEGPRRMMETFLRVEKPQASVTIPEDRVFRDGFDYLEGMDFSQINAVAEQATLEAHMSSGAPCSVLSFEGINERAFGQLFYFFMAACALSGKLLGVNPFDQNGVEAYKQVMFQKLGR